MSQGGKKGSKLSKEDLKAIADVVADNLDEKFEKLQLSIERCAMKEDVEKLKANVRVNRYEFDKLEQYTRRENVRIHNFVPNDSTPLTTQVVDLLNHMVELGTEGDEGERCVFNANDISTCHPIGTNKKQTIVRFISRAKVHDVFRLKKHLKNSKSYKGVFITEDMTSLRLKLREVVKNSRAVTNVYSINGIIHASYKGKKVVISSPDDLFKIDVTPDLDALGLKELA